MKRFDKGYIYSNLLTDLFFSIRLFDLPEGIIPLAMLAFGHPAQTVEPVDRFLPERVHKEQW